MGRFGPGRLAALVAAAIFLSSSFGFAASNSMPATRSGDGSGPISGYTVSRVRYRLRPANPALVNYLTLRLNTSATTVRVQLWSGGPSLTCRRTSGNNWRCPRTGSAMAPVVQLAGLRVVAAQ